MYGNLSTGAKQAKLREFGFNIKKGSVEQVFNLLFEKAKNSFFKKYLNLHLKICLEKNLMK